MGYLPSTASIDRKFPITVEEVILSGLSSKKPLASRFTARHREKASAVIARMGLEGMEQRAIGALSGGQLQRALLGRAIISDPQVVILDEPSTYIDKRFEARLYELLAEINKDCAIISSATTSARCCSKSSPLPASTKPWTTIPIPALRKNGWNATSTAR